MNKHTKILVSVLFAVLIILSAAITRSYVDLPQNTSDSDKQTSIAAIIENDDSGYSVFRSENGKVGIVQSGRIVAAPDWEELSFAGDGNCIASKKIGSRILSGCTDYEGNVTVPLVYSEIKHITAQDKSFYLAKSADNGSFVLYDENFDPCFRHSWESCSVSGNDITVTQGNSTYVYSPAPEGLLFRSANLSGEIMDCGYDLNIYSRVLLSKLSSAMIEAMMRDTEKYFRYAFTGDEELLSTISGGGRSSFSKLFENDERIVSRKLANISNIYIYSVSSSDGSPVFEVSVSADVEITYSGSSGKNEKLRNKCKAAVRFTGSSENSLTAVSGSFDKEAPDYPDPEATTPEEQQ